MPRSTKRKYVAYKQAFKIENVVLKRKDRSKIIQLLSTISKRENVAKKLKEPIHDTKIILKTKITFNYQDQDVVERTFTLPYYAIVHKNNQAFDDLLQEAIKQKLLKNVLNEEMIIKYSDDQEETYTILTCAILYKNYIVIRKVLRMSEEHGILGDILNKKVTIKNGDGQEITYTPFDYAKKDNEVTKIFEEFKNGLNISTIEQKTVIDNTEAIDAPTDAELYKNDNEKVLKDNAITIENKDTASVIDEAVTDKLMCNATITKNEDATAALDEANGTPSLCKKILKDSATTEDKNTTSIEDINKNSEDNPLANIVLAKTTVREQNSLSFKPYFDSVDKGKSPSTWEKQAILAGIVGTALLVGSVVFYVLEVHITVVIAVEIVGLACVGFVLYNSLKPDTKLEKVENVEQPIIQSSLNPI